METHGFLVSGDEGENNAIYALEKPRPGTGGIYVFGEMSVNEQLGIFFKHGRGRAEYSQYTQFYAAGLNYMGLISGREEDILGFGVVHSRHSAAFLEAHEGEFYAAETSYEITYHTEIMNWLSVQPTFQFIQQPGMEVEIPNATVVGLRLSAAY